MTHRATNMDLIFFYFFYFFSKLFFNDDLIFKAFYIHDKVCGPTNSSSVSFYKAAESSLRVFFFLLDRELPVGKAREDKDPSKRN